VTASGLRGRGGAAFPTGIKWKTVLEAHALRTLGVDWHGTTADGAVTLEPVYCLGNCGCGPSLLVDEDELHARVTPAAFDALVAGMRR
jgi:formate dehydrogenase subunit gamma